MARRSPFLMYGIPFVTLIAGAAAVVSIIRTQPVREGAIPVTAPPMQPRPASGEAARRFIGASGIVEPAGQDIALGAHVAGVVSKVLVEAGTRIAKGQGLFVIDERIAVAQIATRRAELEVEIKKRDEALARGKSISAARDAALATAQAARADLDDLEDELRSGEDLQRNSAGTAISTRDLTKRRNLARSAAAKLAEASARAVQAEAELAQIANLNAPTIAVQNANIEQARQALYRAEVDLDLLTVRAPVDATVLQVNVRPGEFAQAGNVTPALMILGNLTPLHVRVDVDEMDIGLFRPDAPAYASLRGQADTQARLSLVRVDPIVVPKKALSGAATERVDTRVLRVVYALPEGVLFAYSGQQVDVFIEAAGAPVSSAPQPKG
jgi:multidrug resistance efflux pump